MKPGDAAVVVPPAPASACPARQRPVLPAVLRSDALFAGQNEILIEHGEQLYRLRRTAQDKLILTK